MLAVSTGLSMTGVAVADENPNAPAAAALAAAEAAVKEADARHALWTSAEDALRKARRALQAGDGARAIDQARIAQKQAELGIAQKGYPLFR
jgi:hypothetical protein